jgi:hypothetical protein
MRDNCTVAGDGLWLIPHISFNDQTRSCNSSSRPSRPNVILHLGVVQRQFLSAGDQILSYNYKSIASPYLITTQTSPKSYAYCLAGVSKNSCCCVPHPYPTSILALVFDDGFVSKSTDPQIIKFVGCVCVCICVFVCVCLKESYFVEKNRQELVIELYIWNFKYQKYSKQNREIHQCSWAE